MTLAAGALPLLRNEIVRFVAPANLRNCRVLTFGPKGQNAAQATFRSRAHVRFSTASAHDEAFPTNCSSGDAGGGNIPPEKSFHKEDRPPVLTKWGSFCGLWNDVVGRRPVVSVVVFSGAVTATWGTTYVALSAINSVWPVAFLGMPELALGWMLMRTTGRLRVPLNIAIAAPVSRVFPSLSELKVSPLLTAFVADKESKQKLEENRVEFLNSLGKYPQLQTRAEQFLDNAARFARWAEGPIDKYGLSYFLTSKVSNVSTLVLGTTAAVHGLDVPSILSSCGFSDAVQADSGILACTAAVNVIFTPLHFYASVASISAMEKIGSDSWKLRQNELRTKQVDFGLTQDEEYQLNMTEEQTKSAVVASAAFLALILDLAFAAWVMKKLYSSQVSDAGPELIPDPPLMVQDGPQVPDQDANGGAVLSGT